MSCITTLQSTGFKASLWPITINPSARLASLQFWPNPIQLKHHHRHHQTLHNSPLSFPSSSVVCFLRLRIAQQVSFVFTQNPIFHFHLRFNIALYMCVLSVSMWCLLLFVVIYLWTFPCHWFWMIKLLFLNFDTFFFLDLILSHSLINSLCFCRRFGSLFFFFSFFFYYFVLKKKRGLEIR